MEEAEQEMEEAKQQMEEVGQELEDEAAEMCKIRGLDLILMSINCQKYKPVFNSYGIDEHLMVHLTPNDLRHMNIDEKDIVTIMTAVNILNKSSSCSDVRLSKDDISKIQSNICGQLGSIALVMNHIYHLISNDKNHFEDILIDDYLSSIDAALLLKPYMKAENKKIEKSLRKTFKLKQSRTTTLITTTAALLFSIAFWRLNNQFNFISTYPNLMFKMKSWWT